MAATGIYKLDDGNCHPTNCFPVRNLVRPLYEEGVGHWEVARQAAEQTRIEWLLGSKSTRIKWKGPEMPCGPHGHLHEKILTATLLMKLHHVKSPSHLCSVDISNRNFTSAKEEDFEPFDSVAYINATENLLTLDVFRKFLALRELELSLNGLRNLKVNAGDFPCLEILDLSYNNLSPEDVRALGVLPHLKALHLTANGLSSLPADLAVPDSDSTGCPRFPALEVLLLDDNHLSHSNVFVSLANLCRLKQLNLDRNGIKEVPYLHHVENARFSIYPLSAKSGIQEGLRTRKSAEIQRKLDAFSRLPEQVDYVAMQNSMDLNRTEFLFSSCSPEPSFQREMPSPRPVSKLSSTSFGPEFVLPLMELRYLSLANNQIEHEEDLLAVALFPSLTELTFYGNPFTTSRSGDPPLLTSFLQDRLGIKLVRKKISKLEKPRIFIPVKSNRKVKSPLPKVQKHPPMLETPHETTFWQLWTGTELDLHRGAGRNKSEPLPPISQFSAEKRLTQEESESKFYSVATFPSQEDMLGLVPGIQTSLDHLCGPPYEIPSMLDHILSASLPPRQSFLGKRSQSGLAAPPISPSAEQDGRSQSGVATPPVSPSAEQDGRSQSGVAAPPVSPSAEQDGRSQSGVAAPTVSPSAEQDGRSQSGVALPTVSPSAEQDGWSQSGVVAPTVSPSAEQDGRSQSGVAAPTVSPSAEQDRRSQSGVAAPTVSPSAEQDGRSQSGVAAPTVSPSAEQDGRSQSGVAAPTVSPSAEQDGRSQSGVTVPTVSPSAEQDPSRSLTPMQERAQSEKNTSVWTPSTEQELSELVALPSPSGQEANLSERFSPPGPPTAEEALSQVLQPVSSASGQPAPSPDSPSEQQALSEPVPPTGSPTGEQDLAGSLPPIKSTSLGQDLPAQLEPAPCRSLPQAQDLLEPTALPRSPSEDQGLSQPRPLVTTPSATQDQSESVPLASSSVQEQVLPELVPPTGSPAREQDLTEPLPPPDEQIRPESSPPLAEQDQTDSLPPAVQTSQEPNWSEAEPPIQSFSVQQEPPKSLPGTSLPSLLSSAQGLPGGVLGATFLPEDQAALAQSSQAWSSSKDLRLLFERELSVSSFSREQLDKKSSSDDLMEEQMESFFMTQTTSDSPETLEKEEVPRKEASAELKRKCRPVPKRYKGYEELLNGPVDPDFVEPRGMEQNVKALEWALRHPLVYREPRARLDSFQKSYVPRKKALQLPVPSVQKTKVQQLEELLQQMQLPTNVVEVPLVCVLRRKKANWREYREALALLKDFRKKYKAMVDTAGEPGSAPKKQSQTQMIKSLTGVRVSGPHIRVPRAPAARDNKGL